jgi:hypothetical protein
MQLIYYNYKNTSNKQHDQLETTTPDSGTITFDFYLEIDNMKVILPSHTYCYLYTNTQLI